MFSQPNDFSFCSKRFMPLVNKHKKRPETLKKSIPKKPLPYLFQAFQTLPVIEKKPFSLSICMSESEKAYILSKTGLPVSFTPPYTGISHPPPDAPS